MKFVLANMNRELLPDGGYIIVGKNGVAFGCRAPDHSWRVAWPWPRKVSIEVFGRGVGEHELTFTPSTTIAERHYNLRVADYHQYWTIPIPKKVHEIPGTGTPRYDVGCHLLPDVTFTGDMTIEQWARR